MDKNILEFGYGCRSTSYCEDGDNLLGAEPVLSYYPEVELPEASLNFFHVDEIAIADKDGFCDIQFNLNDLEHAFTPLRGRRGKRRSKLISVPCLTLDSWIAKYKKVGFTERIDCINCVVNGNVADSIFAEFSFNPRPEVIMIRQGEFPEKAFEILKAQNYKVYTSGSWGCGIANEALLLGK